MKEPNEMTLAEHHPFPWSVAAEDYDCMAIRDADGDLVLCGDVSGGLNYTHPAVPELLAEMVKVANSVVKGAGL